MVSRLSYLRGFLAIAYCFGLGTLRRERVWSAGPFVRPSTRNRRVSESRFSNLPVRSRSVSMGLNGGAGPLSAAAEALAGVCNVLTASAMASGRRQRSLEAI